VRFSELDGAAVGVWGAGREIRSFASQLGRRLPGARIGVIAFDEPVERAVPDAIAPDARVAIGPEAVEALASCDVVVRSPGVSIYKPELRALRERGTPVTTATALWLAEGGGAGVIGITGTKGKSTTAALACHLARATGRDVALAGNIGAPALDLLDREPPELVVLELSSYQIADLPTGPEVAVATSLFREHLDWHGSERAYRADKLKLLGLPGVRVAILNARSPELAEAAAGGAGRVLYGDPEGWDADAAGLSFRGAPAVGAADLPLPGEHNALNACAALAALGAFGIEPPLPAAFEGFRPLPHRLEIVGERGGLLWVDDSISTTPESTLAALAAFPGRDVVLLAGGQDRGQDYAGLGAALAERDAAVVGMPTTGPRVVGAARAAGLPGERAIEADGLEAAVERARQVAAPGGVVLLSPAAPSYDRFRDFEERGERFRELLAAG
jgi:UDP-N-acetylmuramoyl-L-alanine---L-glutamate ligase